MYRTTQVSTMSEKEEPTSQRRDNKTERAKDNTGKAEPNQNQHKQTGNTINIRSSHGSCEDRMIYLCGFHFIVASVPPKWVTRAAPVM